MQAIGQYSLTESILYGDVDIYHWTDNERLEFQCKIIREAFEFHFDNCNLFRRFCSSEGIFPNSICSPQDITRIPLIPSSMFKSLEVRTGPEENIVKVCSSSGTRGSLSRVPRDELSLERFVGSIRIAADQILELRPDAQIFNLGPETPEAGDIWFPYVMSLLGLLRPTENYVANDIFYPRSLLEDLLKLEPGTQPILVGPPIFFLYFVRFLAKEGIPLELGLRDGLVITAGGWKSFSNEQIDHDEFVSQCVEHLGMNDQRGIRDAYNMVELNTVIFECEFGIKHVPPWLVVASLDPGTLVPAKSNEIGLLAFLDPLPTSYPGFILSDDFGSVNSDACSCGRSGPTMAFSRRVALAEGRGCALTMDRNIKVADSVRISERVNVR
jgi:long-chain-fatty-acid---luciferin-component ligase